MLKQHEAGRKVPELAREIGVERGDRLHLEVEVRRHGCQRGTRLKGLEDENRRLKQLVADLSLDKEALKAIVRKNGWGLRKDVAFAREQIHMTERRACKLVALVSTPG